MNFYVPIIILKMIYPKFIMGTIIKPIIKNNLIYKTKIHYKIDDKYIDQIIIYEILCVNIIIHIRSYNNALAI